jgi:trehalose/maltose hydrolase-like predicted phosphorylase
MKIRNPKKYYLNKIVIVNSSNDEAADEILKKWLTRIKKSSFYSLFGYGKEL